MTPDTALDPWLAQFPVEAQPLVTAWFGYAATLLAAVAAHERGGGGRA